MAHFALLDENNTVVYVLVGRDEDDGLEAQLSARTGQVYKQTSYNTRGGVYITPNTNKVDPDQTKAFRKNYAGIGYTYSEDLDAFIPPQPYSSWILNTDTCQWEPPTSLPQDGKNYRWDEATTSWVVYEVSSN
jgi:hypothetical protein